MTDVTMVQAINRALRTAMTADPEVLLLGEDIGVNGGVFRATEGLLKDFGADRVIDTPLSETGIIGTAIGMALYGLKPVAEIQFLDFIYPGFDQIVSELAKFRYRSGGQYPCHVVIRNPLRRRDQGRSVPLAEHGGLLRPHRRPQGSRSFHAGRCLRTAALRDPTIRTRSCSSNRSGSTGR